MPGPFIHISSMRNAGLRLARRQYFPPGSDRINPKWSGADTTQIGRLLGEHPNFGNLGAIGPDLFFFLPDFRDNHGVSISSVLVTVLDFLEELYRAVDPYISKWEKYIGPISEDTAEEMSRLTGGLSETVGDITGELSSILITALEDFVTKNVDFWTFFSLGLDQGYDEQAFFWSDMLHYRDTGQFARAIWRNADATNSDQARAYALGYITHVATDVTGHAFVNSIAGGPFRLHWQRHHLVENHMDAYWYLNDPTGPRSGDNYPQLTESALYYDIAFQDGTGDAVTRPAYPTGGTMRENWDRKRLLDIDSSMPDPLPGILLQSMLDVFYPGDQHPKILSGDGRPTPNLVTEAYDLFFRYLKLVTVDGFSHEPPDPPDVFPNLDFPTISQPGGDSAPGGGGGGDGGGSFWDDLLDFILSVINVITYILEVAVYLATLPWAVLADLVTYPLRLGLYYALELPLFHLLKSFRAVLVMTGYMLPMDDEIAQALITIGNTDSGTFNEVLNLDGDVFGGLLPPAENGGPDQTYRDPNYPHSIPREADGTTPGEFHQPWQYPTTAPELHAIELQHEGQPNQPIVTTSGPHPTGATPSILFADVTGDPAIRDRFETAATPGDADVVGMNVAPGKHLGDAVAFSEYLLWLESRTSPQADGTEIPLVEWNLDSDCGYGYHCWDWNRNRDLPRVDDPENNKFLQPCTWPPQADSPAPLSTPLQLHWVGPGLEDPGCQNGGPILLARSGPDTAAAPRSKAAQRQPSKRKSARRKS
jgi:hypothetical protein